MTRISLDQAQARALELAKPVGGERVPVEACVGRVLAEPLFHSADLPAFDHAAMDGYAIAGGADQGRTYRVRGESRAGAPSREAEHEHALAISTGAALPAGLDTVVPWEDVTRDGEQIVLGRAAHRGQHVRRAGEDARRGTLAIDRDVRLFPRHLALVAALDRSKLEVYATPRVELLATGDELRTVGSPARPGSVVDANGPMLAAMVTRAGGRAQLTHVPDSEEALTRALDSRRANADLLVTIGGAADGPHDHVARALEAVGAETCFRGVAIKPGKPVTLARLGAVPLLCLPGNPGSAFLTFVLLGLPLLRALGGDRDALPLCRPARLTAPLRAPADRTALVYGALTIEAAELSFVPAAPTSSGSIVGLAGARAVALLPAGESRARGEKVDVVEVDAP